MIRGGEKAMEKTEIEKLREAEAAGPTSTEYDKKEADSLKAAQERENAEH